MCLRFRKDYSNMMIKKRYATEKLISKKAIEGDENAFDTLIDMNIDLIRILLRRYSIKEVYEYEVMREIISRLHILLSDYDYNKKKLTIWVSENIINYLKNCSKYRIMFRWADSCRIDCKDTQYIASYENRLTSNEYDTIILKNNFKLEDDEISNIIELPINEVEEVYHKGLYKLNNYYKKEKINYIKESKSRNYETYTNLLQSKI